MKKHRTRIKICGITSVELAVTAVEAGADAIGLVFAKKSPRCIDIDTALEIAESLPPFVTPIGLFQLDRADDPALAEWWGEWVQLHGKEDETLVEQVAESHRVIRGFRFSQSEVARWERCEYVHTLLIDGSPGGGGETFDHAALASMRDEIIKPIILAGGLTAQNVGDAIREVRPFAVDVSSGVERERGVKDAKLIEEYCAAVRDADADIRAGTPIE
jgi:phosphoribosylanthranilate isomerase